MADFNRWILGLVAGVVLSTSALATDLWVAGIGSNSNPGTELQPYRTITFAMSVASGGDVIKVKTGTYDVDAGESFPINVKDNVDIIGQEDEVQDWPRIGGDANENDSTLEALLRVQATSADRMGIDVKNLYFIGQDIEDRDAPSSFLVRVSDGFSATVTFEDNICESPMMNDDGHADRPTIFVEGGYGTTNVSIVTCPTLLASQRAAVEVRNGTDTSYLEQALINVTLMQCNVAMRDEFHALYGFAFIASGEEWGEGRLTIVGNTIDSTHALNHGDIDNGIYVSLESEGEGNVSIFQNYFSIVRNEIVACQDNGISLRCVPESFDAFPSMLLWNFERNFVHDCGEAGLLLERSDNESPAHGGYLNVQSRSNIFASNNYGVRIVDDEENFFGTIHLTNDTIANNDLHGLKLEGDYASLNSLTNCIVYFNNGSGAEYDSGTSGWSPTGTTEYCDFQGLASGEGNIDWDPKFVNMGGGDFHLDNSPWSPCIDTGDKTPDSGMGISVSDIDGDDRVIDGDGDDRPQIDMGADEYVP